MTTHLEPSTLRVALGDRSYDIVVGLGLIDSAGTRLKALLKRPRAVVITDDTVGPLYLKRLCDSLSAANIQVDTITLPAGEQTKCFAQLESLSEKLLEMKVERSTTLIALGGGVIRSEERRVGKECRARRWR